MTGSDAAEQGDGPWPAACRQAQGDGPACRPGSPAAPLFLVEGVGPRARVLLSDLGDFALIQLFYVLIALVGLPKRWLDRRLGGSRVERFIARVERFDDGEV